MTQADVVPFAGTQQQFVRQQGDGFGVFVSGLMFSLQAAHRNGYLWQYDRYAGSS